MPKTALMFGSIGSIMETSDVQRRAYNQALKEAGLDWVWDRSVYAELLNQSGGQERLGMLSAATAAGLSKAQIEQIHARKTELACAELVSRRISLRPGVAQLIALAKSRGMKLAFVTTTYQPNIDALFQAAGDALSASDFDHIASRSEVVHGKPHPEAYWMALAQLGVAAADAIAIEDTAVSVMSAKRAGLTVVATPGEITAGQDFWQADLVVSSLLGDVGAVGGAMDGALNARVVALLG